MIRIEHLSVSYQETLALEELTLRLTGPSITGIIGPNGAGKSTLIQALIGLIPHQGQVLVDQKPIKSQLGKIAYVAQKANLDMTFPLTVRECVALGSYAKVPLFKPLSATIWESVHQALKQVGLEDLAQRQISQLSGGQFQRVLLARCLMQEAQVILLDEPFVGIDSVSEGIIIHLLKNLKEQGKLILIVHHDLTTVSRYFDQILLLNRKLIAYGPTQTTFTEENLRKTYGEHLFFKGDSL
ncbi:metal ABC transporter ATP-binding protein [Streptococcus sp. DD12]|uniref:metal ABC transporter ATP-binding protein n=1 Tax=Streptococcus sp. DD12 TaxID=1777880 RepID=UPI0007947162|nr:metal ABC transporter ATP-binding protein [Streptococcus sp. DD12]KXT77016.1 Manganese ABC transporter, ATP-binding protein SitB [Streptococcus sp. DD12]